MSGSARMLRQRAAGTLMPERAPRLLAMPGPVLTPFNAATAQAAIGTVRQQHDLGADFIKAALMTSEAFYAAQSEARRLGIPILGHLPNGIDVARVSGDGMRSIEHLGPGATLLSCCSTDAGAVSAKLAARSGPKLPPLTFSFLEPVLDRVLAKIVINPVNMSRQPDVDILAQVTASFDQGAVAGLAQRFVADGTWQVPTLIRTRTMNLCDDPEFPAQPGLRYVPPPTLRAWRKAAGKFASFPASSRQTFRAVYATMAHLASLLDAAGVRMLAGSDSGGAAWEVPGIALHQEFDELARAGLPPLRILQMTTRDAVEFLGAADIMGTVDAGKHADLVLLDANPVESADHLHRITGVIRGGHYYGLADLDAIKDNVAARQSAS
jgi:Amidohydrolase family